MKTGIRCNCGQRILSKDVMQTGYYLRLVGPSFVYVKYRCSRCKKLGEQFVKQEDWEDRMLCDCPNELTAEEKAKFEDYGAISVNDCIDAHFALESVETVGDLIALWQETKK